ncbi:MAG: DUF6524 family protein [Oleiphilaceae bacterium]|nr:DUF6524 family protein [Oleiphilaceae bacterium]
MNGITSSGIALRFVFALLLVVFTYNPSGYSYIHWLVNDLQNISPWMLLSGVVLVIGWVIFIRATMRSLGPIGLILASAFVAVLIWGMVDLGWLNLDNASAFIWIVEIFVAGILCLGMSWSHIRRRMSGQVDVDDVEA